MSQAKRATSRADKPPPPLPTPDPAHPGPPPSVAGRALETTQTVLVGLILAFIFRAFFVEPFVIPTGSMAQSLLGAHATRTCPACGWEFDFGPSRGAPSAGGAFVCPPEVICPNCQLRLPASPADTVPKAGDRILVHKWTYALGGLLQPQRWDVIVFRDPANPEQHFLKRLVGLPGEQIEIVDGDVFINGRIARKPPHVQRALWFVVFDQARLAGREATSGRLPRWVALQPPPADGGGWSGLARRVIRYDGLDQTRRAIAFNPDTGRDYLRDFYACNPGSSEVFVGDVRVVAEVTLRAGDGRCRWALTRPPYRFFADLHRDGTVQLSLESPEDPAAERVVGSGAARPFELGRPIAVEFAHVDQRVYLKIDGREVLFTRDAEYAPSLAERRSARREQPVGVQVVAQNLRLELRGLRIDRDVHYTHSPESRRAFAGHPFTLREGEYFVLGDNSPDSRDSREWGGGERICHPITAPERSARIRLSGRRRSCIFRGCFRWTRAVGGLCRTWDGFGSFTSRRLSGCIAGPLGFGQHTGGSARVEPELSTKRSRSGCRSSADSRSSALR